jgi:hypothetical protein
MPLKRYQKLSLAGLQNTEFKGGGATLRKELKASARGDLKDEYTYISQRNRRWSGPTKNQQDD